MKTKLITLSMLLLLPFALSAQTETGDSTFVVDLGTFTGIISVVAFFVTQLIKLIPYVEEHRWAKIVSAIVVGLLICLGCWAAGLAPFMAGLDIWQILLYGIGSGLSACGFYDIVKPFINVFCKPKEIDPDEEDF